MGGGSPFDFDVFDFVVAAGTELTSIQFFLNFAVASGLTGLSDERFIGADFAQTTFFGAGGADPNPNPLFVGSTYGAGTYTLSHSALATGLGPFSANWSYTLSFEVVAVPEPSTLGLLGVGLLVLLARRRRA